jgi:group I intron endonuclease
MNSGIYKIVCLNSGKIYIGQSVNIKTRKKDHFSNLRNNRHDNQHIQNAWNKYGESNFVFEVIEEVDNFDLLTEREQYWMDTLKSYDKKIGFNITPIAGLGGCLGRKHTEEAKRKIGLAHKGKTISDEHKNILRKAQLGRKHTKEHREKCTRARIGIHAGEKNPQAKYTWELINELRDKYKTGEYTQKELCSEYNMTSPFMSNVLRNKTWKDKDYDPDDRKMKKTVGNRAKFDMETVRKIRAEYYDGDLSQADMARKYGVSTASMNKLLLRRTYPDNEDN